MPVTYKFYGKLSHIYAYITFGNSREFILDGEYVLFSRSDDEDEETHTSTKPNVPKKPTLPVPIPSQTVISTEANKISSHNPPNRNRDYNDAAESINKTHDSNILDQSEQLNDDTTEPTVASYPTLVLNDEGQFG